MLYTVNFVKRSNVTKINKTRRMAITNGTCVSFCYQPKAHYLATSRVTPVCRCLQPICECSLQAFGLRQESLRNILASPEYAPGTIVVNVTFIEREFNACQTPRSMYPQWRRQDLMVGGQRSGGLGDKVPQKLKRFH